MKPLDLTQAPPRSCYAQLDNLMMLPRTIDKLRARLPGGDPGEYIINGQIKGMSGFLLERLGVSEHDLLQAVAAAETEEDVAKWLRKRVDTSQYHVLNETLARIQPKHAEDPEYFRSVYAETLAANPDLVFILDIVDADDRRMFPNLTT